MRRVQDTLDAHVAALREVSERVDGDDHRGTAGPVDHLHTAVAELWRFCRGFRGRAAGHPMALARLGPTWLLAPPGNPQSAIVPVSLGKPLFDALLGRRSDDLPQVMLAQAAKAPDHEHRLLACGLDGLTATPVQHLGSAMLRGLAAADGFAVLPPVVLRRRHRGLLALP